MGKINALGQATDVTADQAEGNVYRDSDVEVPVLNNDEPMAALNPDANPAHRPADERTVERDADKKEETKPSTSAKSTPRSNR